MNSSHERLLQAGASAYARFFGQAPDSIEELDQSMADLDPALQSIISEALYWNDKDEFIHAVRSALGSST